MIVLTVQKDKWRLSMGQSIIPDITIIIIKYEYFPFCTSQFCISALLTSRIRVRFVVGQNQPCDVKMKEMRGEVEKKAFKKIWINTYFLRLMADF